MGGRRTFQGGYPFLKHVVSGVHDPAVEEKGGGDRVERERG